MMYVTDQARKPIAADIGRYAKCMSYYDDTYNWIVTSPMATCFRHSLERIKRLYMEYVKFEIVDVFMVKKSTHLQELRIKGFLSTAIPEIIANSHQMLKLNFKVFYLETCKLLSKNEAVLCLALLVILCPTLVDIAASGKRFKILKKDDR